jgi:hypothetical protein
MFSICRIKFVGITILVMALTAASPARAIPIDYTVSGTTDLTGGGTETITGSFTFDTATDTESNVSITLSGGDASLDGTYDQIAPVTSAFNNEITATGPLPEIFLDFANSLNVSPDSLSDVSITDSACFHTTCFDTSPQGSAIAAPEPASLTLLAVGLAGLGMVVRLRRTSSRRDHGAARLGG